MKRPSGDQAGQQCVSWLVKRKLAAEPTTFV